MEPDAKNPRGRPRFAPTEAQRLLVVALHGAGLPLDEVRLNILGPGGKPIAEGTFRRCFRRETEAAKARFGGAIAKRYFQLLHSRDEKTAIRAVEIGAKSRLGWRETSRTELTGADGGPLQVGVAVLTAEEAGAKLLKVLTPFLAKRITAALPALPPGALPPLGIAPEVAWALIEKSNFEPYRRLDAWREWNARDAGLIHPGDVRTDVPQPPVTASLEGGAVIDAMPDEESRHGPQRAPDGRRRRQDRAARR